MRLSFRVASVGCVAVLLSLAGIAQVHAQQQQINNGNLSGEMKSLTAVVGPSTEVSLLSIPADKNFVLTQVCRSTGSGSDYRIHNVGGGGNNSQVTLDNTECQEYTPGLVFYGGDDVVFRNNNNTATVRVVVNGILTKK